MKAAYRGEYQACPKERYAASRDTTVIAFRQREAVDDPLSELAREGGRRMLAQVLIAEANLCRHGRTCIAGWPRPHRASWPWAASCNPDRSRACRGPSRQSARPGRRGRRGENPLQWARRTKSLDALLPVLYLRGVSTGDFQEVLTALLGKNAPNLSPAVITRLTAEWQADYDAWHSQCRMRI